VEVAFDHLAGGFFGFSAEEIPNGFGFVGFDV